MSTTPRTDEFLHAHYVDVEFARQLEIELADMTLRAEKAESSLHDLSLDLSTANHMIKLERDRADALQTRLNELGAILKKHNLID